MENYPKFQLEKSRFNLVINEINLLYMNIFLNINIYFQDTYSGRLYHNFDLIDPRTLLSSQVTYFYNQISSIYAVNKIISKG